MMRSLCEMVRRVPTDDAALRQCWGFGGAGVRAERHGAFLLAALAPHAAGLRALHGAVSEAAPQPQPSPTAAEPSPTIAKVASPAQAGSRRETGRRTRRAAGEGTAAAPGPSVKQEQPQEEATDTEERAAAASVPPRKPKRVRAEEVPTGRTTRATSASAAGKRMARV